MNKENINNIINNRFKIIRLVILIIFIVIISFLIKITIFDNKEYNKLLHKKTDKIYYKEESPRGNIYDRNMKLLVGNKIIKSIVYNKTNLTLYEELKMADKISKHIKIDYSKLNKSDIENYLIIKNKNVLKKRMSKKEIIKYENKEYSQSEYNNLLKKKIKEEELNINEEEKKTSYIYKLMNIGYAYEEKTIKEESTEEEFAYFSEYEKKYKGVIAKTKYKRISL